MMNRQNIFVSFYIMFKKLGKSISRGFKKGVSEVEHISKTLGSTAGQIQKGLGTVSKIVSPLAPVAMMVAPELAPAIGAVGLATGTARQALGTAQKVSSAINPQNYHPLSGVTPGQLGQNLQANALKAMNQANVVKESAGQIGIQRPKDVVAPAQPAVSFA
jgi:hypothetical protein